MNYGSEFQNKSSLVNQERMMRWLMDSTTNHRDFQRMNFHNYVNKEITFARSKGIMMHAQGKPTQLNIGSKMHP